MSCGRILRRANTRLQSGGYLPPGNAPFFWNPSARPPRTLQWSIGIQREVTKDLVVEVSYVGNRGVWWSAPGHGHIRR